LRYGRPLVRQCRAVQDGVCKEDLDSGCRELPGGRRPGGCSLHSFDQQPGGPVPQHDGEDMACLHSARRRSGPRSGRVDEAGGSQPRLRTVRRSAGAALRRTCHGPAYGVVAADDVVKVEQPATLQARIRYCKVMLALSPVSLWLVAFAAGRATFPHAPHVPSTRSRRCSWKSASFVLLSTHARLICVLDTTFANRFDGAAGGSVAGGAGVVTALDVLKVEQPALLHARIRYWYVVSALSPLSL
jgi:hypothetical protein